MAAGEIRIIRRRIKSVQSTMKITRAMELIAASRILKAEQRVAAARPYAMRMAAVLGNLAGAAGGDVSHPLLETREEIAKSAVLVISADRGLCGGYNTNVLKLAERTLADADGEHAVFAVGRKSAGYFRYRKVPLLGQWQGLSDQPRYEQAREVAERVMQAYLDGEVDQVTLVYTRFVSAARQELTAVPFLPIDTGEITSVDEKVGRAAGEQAPNFPAVHDMEEGTNSAKAASADTIFEPDPAEILSDLLPKGLTSKLYSAMLDSSASEHAERRRAMKSATDNAKDLIRILQIQGNKARQAAITTEILEVVGGAEALAKE